MQQQWEKRNAPQTASVLAEGYDTINLWDHDTRGYPMWLAAFVSNEAMGAKRMGLGGQYWDEDRWGG